MKNDFGSQKCKKMVQPLKQFWKKIQKHPQDHLNSPKNHSEFNCFLQKLEVLTLNDIYKHSLFQELFITSTNVQSVEIFNNSQIIIQLIFLPPHYLFDIHDHPEMLVVLKILLGEVDVSKFDLINQEGVYQQIKYGQFTRGTVELKDKIRLRENEVDFVYPAVSNLHSIYTLKRTVLMDVMVNSYDFTKRPCTFFRLGENIQGDFFEIFHFDNWKLGKANFI